MPPDLDQRWCFCCCCSFLAGYLSPAHKEFSADSSFFGVWSSLALLGLLIWSRTRPLEWNLLALLFFSLKLVWWPLTFCKIHSQSENGSLCKIHSQSENGSYCSFAKFILKVFFAKFVLKNENGIFHVATKFILKVRMQYGNFFFVKIHSQNTIHHGFSWNSWAFCQSTSLTIMSWMVCHKSGSEVAWDNRLCMEILHAGSTTTPCCKGVPPMK